MLKIFLQSYKKNLPQYYSKYINSLATHPNLIIHQPVVAVPASHPSKIILKNNAQSLIPRGVNIFMLSTSQSFTSTDLVGASIQDKITIQNNFLNQSQNYEILNSQEIKGLFKVIIQIYANQIELSKGKMPLYHYANILINQAQQDSSKPSSLLQNIGLYYQLKKYEPYIKSNHLLNILRSNEGLISKLYEILCAGFVKTSTEDQFKNLLKVVRSQLKQLKQTSNITMKGSSYQISKVQTLSPILSSLKESYTPNCHLVGKYFTHLRNSYYCLETLRPIKPNEVLTIPARNGVNNYDKFIRYGYKSIIEQPENPYNQYMLIIDFLNPAVPFVQQTILSGDIDNKKQILLQNNLKLKNIIKIKSNGAIKEEDLKMLRILFGIDQYQQIEAECLQIDKKIYQLVSIFVEASLRIHQAQAQKQPKVDKNHLIDNEIIKCFRIIEKGETQILSNFLNTKNKIFGSRYSQLK